MPSKLIKKPRFLKRSRATAKSAPAAKEKKEATIKLDKRGKEQVRRKLMEKKEAIISKLSRTVEESKEVETDIARDVADKAENSYTKEFLLSLSDTEREQLMHIDQALRSLEKGHYGICQLCGRPITKKRLEALPWSVYCLECQQKIEAGTEMESEA